MKNKMGIAIPIPIKDFKTENLLHLIALFQFAVVVVKLVGV